MRTLARGNEADYWRFAEIDAEGAHTELGHARTDWDAAEACARLTQAEAQQAAH